MRRWMVTILFIVVGAAIVIQVVPYGRHHSNPPVLAEPRWDSPQTRVLAARACFDCHSNETVWPWYSDVAPFSWLVQRDVDEGRRAVNFSEWNRPQKEARESAKAVRKREMPPRIYTIRSSSARLSAAEREALAAGLATTLGSRHSGAARSSSED